jgi:hypothetical protein
MELKKIIVLSIAVLLLSSIVLAQISFHNSQKTKKLEVLKGLKAKVYKTPYCSCCDLHIGYMRSYGIEVEVVEMEDISGIKNSLGVPDELLSCHTTVIKDYFIEGHVPIEAISKLIEERPDVKGISLPGMPSGSPGMPGAKEGTFVIYSVDDGGYSEFMVI